MKRKILTIIISMLFIAMIPTAIGEIANPESNDIEPCLDVGRCFLKGFGFFPQREGNEITFFVIRFRMPNDVCWFQWITIKDSAYSSRLYIIGKNIVYVFGFFQGGLEIA